ncbi:hypothetical protein [Streptomyces sp. NPDC002287]
MLLLLVRRLSLEEVIGHSDAPVQPNARHSCEVLRSGNALLGARSFSAVAHLPQPENSRTLTAFAAGFGGYWEKASRRPAPPGIPFLRAHQIRAAEAARAWLRHRTEWE